MTINSDFHILDSLQQLKPFERAPIAIIGIGCRFPGEANNPEDFWKLLRDGVDTISEVPADRWQLRSFYDPDPAKPGKTSSRWGGFVKDIDQYDAEFFGISPREAARMDPQQRLLTEVAYEAIDDAHLALEHLTGSSTGVYIGISTCDYGGIQMVERRSIDAYTNLGLGLCISANRISYLFDFHGPSMSIDTACSSSLVATHLACQGIWNGECVMALAGGVNLMIRPEGTIGFSKASMLAPDGRCKSFDARANGYVRSEGAAIVVLKPLYTAQADGDPIYAIIRGTGVNQDGHTTGIALPSRSAQEAMLRETYQQAGVAPQQVHYIEAHGTGTPVGDPIEATALGNVFGGHRTLGDDCVIGSVKGNIGHLEAASGVAGLIKAALCLKNRQIPTSLHFETPNPEIPFESLRLRVPQRLEPWPSNGATPRLAGVNSFGFGGTNAHVVLEEAPEPPDDRLQSDAPILLSIGRGYGRGLNNNKISPSLRTVFKKYGIRLSQNATVSIEQPGSRWLITDAHSKHIIQKRDGHLNIYNTPVDGRALILPISAQSPVALQAFAQSYLTFLENGAAGEETPLSDICYTASLRRGHHDHRLALVARSKEEFAEHLRAYLEGETRPSMSSGRRAPSHPPKLAFVFSGMGPQWWGMGRQLLEEEAVFREIIEQCDALLQQHVEWSLLEELTADEEHSRINETQIAQPAIFSLQTGLAALWGSWGIKPDAILGHSVGEVAAAHVAGALTLEDAIQLVFHRSRLQQQTAGQGKMLAIGLPWEEAEHILERYEEYVSVAAINSPGDVTLSGDADALEEIARLLEQKQVLCRYLQVEVPYHSPKMEPLKTELLRSLEGLHPQLATIPLFSTATGQAVKGPELDASYWWQNIRNPVRFAAVIDELTQAGHNVFLELSPQPVLASSISKCLTRAQKEGSILTSLKYQETEHITMLGSLGKLYTSGYPVDWKWQYPQGGHLVKLPSYPWQRERHWHEPEESRQDRLGLEVHPLLGVRLESAYPAWTVELEKQPLAYLDDHRVQDAVVYPAAAYVEMALAAARETFGQVPCVVEEIALQRAILLSGAEPLSVQFVRDPIQGSFEIYSHTNDTEQTWILHASGKLRRLQEGGILKQVVIEEIRNRCRTEIPKSAFYLQLHKAGLQYGPYFQGVEQLWCGEGEALGEIQAPAALETEIDEYLLHPTILDASFHVLVGAIATVALKGLSNDQSEGVYLPVRIERVRFYRRPGLKFYSYTRLVDHGPNHFTGDIQLLDDEGNLLAELQGFQCRAIERPSEKMDTYLYEYQWKLKARPGQVFVSRKADFIPSPQQIAERIQPEGERLSEQFRLSRYKVMEPQVKELANAYLLSALREVGWEFRLHDCISVDALAEKLNVIPHHKRLLERMFEILSEDGVLKQNGEQWEVCQQLEEKDPNEIWRSLWGQFPALQAELMLVRQCGEKLAEVLTGELDPLEAIFPQGSLSTAEHLYQDAPSYQIYNLLAQKAVAMAIEHLPEGRTVRILEIGGGTGGMTTYILRKLPPDRTEYVFTDVTQLLTSQAEQKFRDYSFVQYKLLDIETDPVAQGYDAHTFDIILASDVLHATRDLRETLNNVKQLLASEGLLVLLELTNTPRWVVFVFGLLKGWWLFTDTELRGKDPWISQKAWENLLKEVGFTEVGSVADTRIAEEALHSVIIARGPDLKHEAKSAEVEAPPPERSVIMDRGPNVEREVPIAEAIPPLPEKRGTWLIFADSGGVGQDLADRLRERGEIPILISPGEAYQCVDADHFYIRPEQFEDMNQLLEAALDGQPECRGVIHLWSLDAPPPEETTLSSLESAQTLGCINALYLVQALAKVNWSDSSRLWLVTSGAQPAGSKVKSVSVVQSPQWGLSRTIINEYPNLHCRMVDLSLVRSSEEIQSLLEELWSEDPEDEIALRGEARYVHRLTRVSQAIIQKRTQQKHLFETSQPFSVEVSMPGVLDDLTFRAITRREPCKGEVEIEIYATSLNFKDIMLAMGLLPDEALEGGYTGRALGMECSGKIVAVGKGVEGFNIGDEVVTSGPGALRTHMTINAGFVVPKPDLVSFEEAATIPIAFLTAYYSLHHLGQMSKGDRVLIHAATGGVGLAAIQLAQRAGAEVFATAGTPQKRALLQALGVKHVMDSRSLAFAEEVMKQTNGKGVDIVLNSLAGEAIPKSISVLSPYGRFIEIGKIDIYQNSKLGLRPFRNNLSYFAVDMDRLGAERPDLIRDLLHEVIERFVSDSFVDGALHPISYRLFPISGVVNAFRYMAQAKHIGKVIISLQNPDVVVTPPPKKSISFRSDGTYLITGGLGGFGLAVAQWLVERGARHLVLMGRSGAGSPEVELAIEAMERNGVEVVVAKADVTQEEQVSGVLADIRQSMPPLRGIVHAAMVLDDALLHQLNAERMWKAMAPKVIGAWNLHTQTLNLPLDFFVLFSSFSSIIGTTRQGNYVAANAFLDALAHYRRMQGLPALTINWGVVAGVGYVAQNADLGQKLAQFGFKSLPSQRLLKILGMLMGEEAVQVGVGHLDWQQLAKMHMIGTTPRFTYLVEPVLTDNVGGVGAWVIDAILAVEPAKRQEFLVAHIREQLAKVLGTSPSKVDVEKPLLNMGLDSLMAVEIGNQFQSELGISVPPVKFMEGLTVTGLAEYIIEQLTEADSTLSVPAQSRQETAEQLLAKVDQLSDKEVDSVLREIVGEEVDLVDEEVAETKY